MLGAEWDILLGHTVISPMNMPAVQLVRALILLLAVACHPTPNKQAQIPNRAGDSIEKRIKAIQVEAKRIDAANEVPDTIEHRQLTKDLPHWQLYGLLETSVPIFLDAMFTEGQVVRQESYYLAHGKLLLVKVVTWWDVDDPRKAPEPATEQDFYIDNDQTIRHTIKTESTRPVTRTDDTARAAAGLVDRSQMIAKILLGARDAPETDLLRRFPDAERHRP